MLGERGRTRKVAQKTPFTIKRLMASVSVPRSYFVSVFEARYGADQEAKDDDPRFKTLINEQLAEIEKVVKPLIDAKPADEDSVQVSWFYDSPPVSPRQAQELEAGGMAGLVRTYGTRAGLAALAVLGLLMMLMMARRASAGGAWTESGAPGGAGPGAARGAVLTAGAPPVGDAEVSDGVLVAQELDEQTVRVQKVVEQIDQLVRENPGSAAALINRWVEQDK